MKLGILGAMHEEVAAIKNLMSNTQAITIAGRTYYEGFIKNIPVVLTFSRWGKVASAITTTTLINQFSVDFVLFTGVAGAVDGTLQIGDIVVATGLYQHDMDAQPFFQKFQIPLTEYIVFRPALTHVTDAQKAAEAFVESINTRLDNDLLIKFSIGTPSVRTGIIASGDQFISDVQNNPNLNHALDNPIKGTGLHVAEKAVAVEMEGAAVAQVCTEHDIPYVIIRTISDKADHSAHIDFHMFIKEVASQYAVHIIEEWVSNIN